MGDRIEAVKMYTGPHSASVKPVEWPPRRAPIMTGNAAELPLGMTSSPERAKKDFATAAELPLDAGDPSPRRMLITHLEAFHHLRTRFVQAREEQTELDGSEVHDFLEERGCRFGEGDSEPARWNPEPRPTCHPHSHPTVIRHCCCRMTLTCQVDFQALRHALRHGLRQALGCDRIGTAL